MSSQKQPLPQLLPPGQPQQQGAPGPGQPLGGGVNTSRPTACTNCHTAKVRCDFNTPCERCVRLNKTCIPHVSQQGRGRKRRKKNKSEGGGNGGGADVASSSEAVAKAAAKAAAGGITSTLARQRQQRQAKRSTGQPTEDVLCKSIGSIAIFNPNHYGIRVLIRSWVSFAIRRRSFALLSRAGTLAARVGITMDDVFCSNDVVEGNDNDGKKKKDETYGDAEQQQQPKPQQYHQGPVDFLYPALIMPADKQDLGDTRLRWSEIPSDLLAAAGCCAKAASLGAGVHHCDASKDPCMDDPEKQKEAEEAVKECQNAAEMAAIVEEKSEEEILASVLGDRWIFVREMKQGRSRYFCSPAFERDVCSWQTIKDTWLANEREVASLFLPSSEKGPYVRALMHQMTIQETAGIRPRASRYSSKILVKNDGGGGEDERTAVNVDQISCMKIVDVDCSFFYNEYVRVEVSMAKTLASMSTTAAAAAAADKSRLAPSPPPSVTPVVSAASSVAAAATGEEDLADTEWLDLDQITDLGDLEELMTLLDEARSTFESDI